MEYVIGMDGGGTKTEAVLADSKGHILARAVVGPSNPNLISATELKRVYQTLLESLQKEVPVEFAKATQLFAGSAGVGNDETSRKVTDILRAITASEMKIQVESDAVNALYSGTYGEAGIVQIAGTGSITYGLNEKRQQQRVGGWGYLFGDEGSGYDIGRNAISAVLDAKDGHGKPTLLTGMILEHFCAKDELDMVQKIYAYPAPKTSISPLTKIVFEAYKQTDAVAVTIVSKAAADMCSHIKTLYKQHFQQPQKIRIVLCGGVFEERSILPPLVEQGVSGISGTSICLPEIPPAGGSVIGAYLMSGIKPDLKIIENMKNTYKRR